MNEELFSLDGFILRIRSIMKREGIDHWNKFEQEIGMRGATGRWKSGKDKPTPDSLLKIGRRFRVSVDWLLTGEKPNLYGALEMPEHYESRRPAPVDTELISQIVVIVETYLEEMRLKIGKERKGALISLLYEYRVTEKDHITPEVIKANLRLTHLIKS